MKDVFEGVRRNDLRTDADLRRLSAILASRGQIAYRVTLRTRGFENFSSAQDKRVAERRRIRLRSGKLLDADNRFVCECLMLDQSKTGFRIKLSKNVGVPSTCRIYEDETGDLFVTSVVWRKDGLLGLHKIRRLPGADLKPGLKNMLSGRYYAVDD